jgi:hypothetical protein
MGGPVGFGVQVRCEQVRDAHAREAAGGGFSEVGGKVCVRARSAAVSHAGSPQRAEESLVGVRDWDEEEPDWEVEYLAELVKVGIGRRGTSLELADGSCG